MCFTYRSFVVLFAFKNNFKLAAYNLQFFLKGQSTDTIFITFSPHFYPLSPSTYLLSRQMTVFLLFHHLTLCDLQIVCHLLTWTSKVLSGYCLSFHIALIWVADLSLRASFHKPFRLLCPSDKFTWMWSNITRGWTSKTEWTCRCLHYLSRAKNK